MKPGLTVSLALAAALVVSLAWAYPLNGEADSGIRRLAGYRLAQQSPTGAKLAPGALLGVDDIRLRLVGTTCPNSMPSPRMRRSPSR
jgi:hypothetical protein